MQERATVYFVEGDTWQATFEVTDSNGDPYSFTGLTAHMQFRRDINSASAFATLTSGSGLEIDTPAAGSIRMTVPSNLTAGICRGALSVDVLTELEVRSGSSPPVVTTLSALRIVVLREGTRV